jgi:hypothetical protein
MPREPGDELVATAAASIGANRRVAIVRYPSAPQERRWQTRMGGNFSNLALFLKHDEVQIGDAVYCDGLDEQRVVCWVTQLLSSSAFLTGVRG